MRKVTHIGQMIKLADLISNTCSIVEHGTAFAPIYLPKKPGIHEAFNEIGVAPRRISEG
ncbi:hypothetical protein [Gimibacter soli]|uniref:Uncharacterized protein n=1 Tax=Gimibacter soli TaxID=3024400 RepID=A0AAE9XKL5_9PROT|nr:hypothetical protein [Gimibacter soli]WCL52909.1 hypothetical protein PH603_10200 [Gimibacter soli]